MDKSQQPAYTLLCLQQWLGLVLDLLVAAIAIILIILAVLLRGTTTAGQIGMAMNLVLVANTTLLALVNSWTNMEISLGAMCVPTRSSQFLSQSFQDSRLIIWQFSLETFGGGDAQGEQAGRGLHPSGYMAVVRFCRL